MVAIGSINENSKVYSRTLTEVIQAYNTGSLTILCGAGLSIDFPSSLRNGEQIRDDLVGRMMKCSALHKVPANADRLEQVLRSRPLELILDSLRSVYHKKVLNYLNDLDTDRWNSNHYCVARLAYLRPAFKVITLNFDVLIESVLETFEASYTVRCPLAQDMTRKNKHATPIEIVKPHGSFKLPNERGDRAANLTTTLSEIRDKPDPRTVMVFEQALNKTSIMLVVGYRGQDWDIIPIFLQLKQERPNLRLVWVSHCNRHESTKVKDGQRPHMDEPSQTAWDLIDYFGCDATVLFGKTSSLLINMLKSASSEQLRTLKNPERKCRDRKNDVEKLIGENVATIVAITDLIQDIERPLAFELFSWLGLQPELKRDHYAFQHYLNIFAWWRYINRDFDLGIRLRQQALRINRKQLHRDDHQLATDMVSTGYQLISYVKPRKYHVDELIKAPWYLALGLLFLWCGAHSGSKINKSFAAYYIVDFLHAWALMLLLFGRKRCTSMRKLVFKGVSRLYGTVEAKYGDIMDREYFYLRRAEADILAGMAATTSYIERTLKRIKQIEDYFILTRQLDHLRNVCATKAFVKFTVCQNDPLVLAYIYCALIDSNSVEEGVLARPEVKTIIETDQAASCLVGMVKMSTQTITITKSGLMRYRVFLRFFNPEQISVMDVIKGMK